MDRLPPRPLSGYDADFAQWIEEQTELLRARDFEHLDLNRVIEEFEEMAANLRHELKSRIETLLVHLLKCQVQPERKSGSWIATIHEQRRRILDRLEQSPSLKRHMPELTAKSYMPAVRRASAETGLARAVFPEQNPYTAENLLNEDFVP